LAADLRGFELFDDDHVTALESERAPALTMDLASGGADMHEVARGVGFSAAWSGLRLCRGSDAGWAGRADGGGPD
jgi:hypothetical protein